MTDNDTSSLPRRRRRRSRKRPRSSGGDPTFTPLHERVSSHFKHGDRQRGYEYFRRKRVDLEVKGTRAKAVVKGKSQSVYAVGVDWSRVTSRTKRFVRIYCECERFASGAPCKHVWATLLQLAETGEENQPPGDDQLAVRRDKPKSWQDLESFAASRRGPRRKSQKSPPQKKKSKAGRKQPSQPDPNSWKSQLASVRREVEKLSDDEARRQALGRRRRRRHDVEYRLLINTMPGLSSTGLVLDVFKGGGSAGRIKPASIRPEELEELLFPHLFEDFEDEEHEEDETEESEPDEESTERDEEEDEDVEEDEDELAEVDPEALETDEETDEDIEDEAGEQDGEQDGEEHDETGEEDDEPLPNVITALPRPRGQQGQRGRRARGRKGKKRPPVLRRFLLPPRLYDEILPRLSDERRLGWWDGESSRKAQPLTWDAGEPWTLALQLEVTKREVGKDHAKSQQEITVLRGILERGDESVPLDAPVGFVPDVDLDPESDEPGPFFVVFPDEMARFRLRPERDLPWLDLFESTPEIVIPKEDLEDALTKLLEIPLPQLEVPEEVRLSEERGTLEPRLVLEADSAPEWMDPPLLAELSFVYGDMEVKAGDSRPAIVDWKERTFLRRDMDREHKHLLRLLDLGLTPVTTEEGHSLQVAPERLAEVAEPLLIEGWNVEVRGTSLRVPSPPQLKVESGVDWFELSGEMDFAGSHLDLSRVLDAVSKGERFVELEDGSQGLLPESLVETYDSLSQLSHESSDEGLRFLPSQAMLVDALLAGMPTKADKSFSKLRGKLRSLDSIQPKKELKSFQGELRGYQRMGLGWLSFLREFGLGGVLADDMGLGKTVQVLALIQSQRTKAKTTGRPFLVVAPRSLLYNWIDEAKRFTPKLKVVEYAGPDREELQGELDEYDIVITTYGTLRRDVGFLATVDFDTLILDEAQAIKNRDSQSAKASRALNGRHRLALTGTPIENHLGELGSIFEFLNPGLFGRLPKLEALTSSSAPSRGQLKLVQEGMRPFILRRTKEQVLTDLPPKTEQTLHCSLRPEQRELYDQLRTHYQQSLLDKVGTEGVGKNSFQVLEALLRLRQVACHPGLVDEEWESAGSAKLEALYDHVSEIIDEGHKVIVFSQFTKLLAYVKRDLDEKGLEYAYLDGQTRHRGEVVERFQTDPACNLFLISIKAGGVGLNLTAAGYVFLLDPWWNPAVEAQAIDRAHRIGQTQPVFAYRMIARDTVEEKILELQRSKKKLADAILDGDGKLMSDLTADDLKMLLG